MRFLSDRRGNVAIFFAIAMVPIFGMAAVAVDFSRGSGVRTHMQTRADSAALTAAIIGKAGDDKKAIAQAIADIESRYVSNGTISALAFAGKWISDTDYRVEGAATLNTAFVKAMPGFGSTMQISVSATARVTQDSITYDPPVVNHLDPEAGDFNEIYVYCFQYDKPGPAHARRKQMTLIADNMGNKIDFKWPKCGEGEALSFRLRNVRHAKAYPELWKNPNQWPFRPEYNWHTDTTIEDGVETFNLPHPILETVRCDNLKSCVPKSKGGVLPEGKNRKPQVEARACEPGKFMYYGWEDRPPGLPGADKTWTDPAWTDRDYDDIRIVMQCPDAGQLGKRLVRLIK